MGITKEEIRASIDMGGLIIKTPYIQSFSVRKVRGQPSSFDASLKVQYEQLRDRNIDGPVKIDAGTSSHMPTIFTGIIKKATISPCWNDPGFVFFNISGVDSLGMLQGKKYTRRCKATKGVWISIDSSERTGLRDGKFAYNTNTVSIDTAESFQNITELNETKQQGKNIGKSPKTPEIIPAIVELSKEIIEGTGVAP